MGVLQMASCVNSQLEHPVYFEAVSRSRRQTLLLLSGRRRGGPFTWVGRRSDLRRSLGQPSRSDEDGWRLKRLLASNGGVFVATVHRLRNTKIYCGVPDGGDVNVFGRQN
jgi:hypothetical protein